MIKPLPKKKPVNEIHEWWDYGINLVTGYRVKPPKASKTIAGNTYPVPKQINDAKNS